MKPIYKNESCLLLIKLKIGGKTNAFGDVV